MILGPHEFYLCSVPEVVKLVWVGLAALNVAVWSNGNLSSAEMENQLMDNVAGVTDIHNRTQGAWVCFLHDLP